MIILLVNNFLSKRFMLSMKIANFIINLLGQSPSCLFVVVIYSIYTTLLTVYARAHMQSRQVVYMSYVDNSEIDLLYVQTITQICKCIYNWKMMYTIWKLIHKINKSSRPCILWRKKIVI